MFPFLLFASFVQALTFSNSSTSLSTSGEILQNAQTTSAQPGGVATTQLGITAASSSAQVSGTASSSVSSISLPSLTPPVFTYTYTPETLSDGVIPCDESGNEFCYRPGIPWYTMDFDRGDGMGGPADPYNPYATGDMNSVNSYYYTL